MNMPRLIVAASLLRQTIYTLGLSFSLWAQSAWAIAPASHAVASPHPLATEAGLQILRQGGNAFDAAIAVSAALAVVEPYGSGVGGGGFFLVRQAQTNDDPLYQFLDARERAPLAAQADLYRRNGQVQRELSLNGPLAAAIPGLPAGWVSLAEQHGSLPLSVLLAPAIHWAEQGFPVDETYQERAGWRLNALREDPTSAQIFLRNKQIPALGTRIIQPDLAKTLKSIAKYGNAGFYQGPIAQQMVTAVRASGGIWSLQDLRDYRTEWREPLLFPLANERTLISAPPPSAGGLIVAQALGLLERTQWAQANPAEQRHLLIEALRQAYRDRGLLGDPDFVTQPIAPLLDAAYLDRMAQQIDPQRATPSAQLAPRAVPTEGTDTTHFAVLDQQGNAVAATLSLNMMFGAAYTVPNTGVLLNDQMDDFAADLQGQNAYGLAGSVANQIAAGKRPLSSMSPTFIESPRDFITLGAPGGSRIPSMVVIASLAYFQGADALQAAAQPRLHHQYLPDVVEYEHEALTQDEQAELQQRGHHLKEMQRNYGNQQIIIWDKDQGHVDAASDPRGQGVAATLSSPHQ